MNSTDPIWFTPPPKPSRPPSRPEPATPAQIEIKINGQPVRVAESATILDACQSVRIDTPTLCYAENLTPVNVCRVCVVELAGSRTLVPACSRKVEPNMVVLPDSAPVRTS